MITREIGLLISENIYKRISKLYKKRYTVGSIRRKEPTLHDIDILLLLEKNSTELKMEIIEKITNNRIFIDDNKFTFNNLTKRVDQYTKRLFFFENKTKIKIEIYLFFDINEEGAQLLYTTGSKEFNIGMRTYAKIKGYFLNEHGIFDNNTRKKIHSKTEKGIFNVLNVKYIPPSKRTNWWDIYEKYKIKK